MTDTQAKLREESCLREEAEKAKTNLTTELTTLREQMDKAKDDAVAEFWVSQPFFDVCNAYYDGKFDDCLKQVGAAYPDLNLSQIAIDDTMPLTPGRDDIVNDVTIDSVHTVEQEAKDTDGVVIAKLALEGLRVVVAPSAMDSSPADGASTVHSAAIDALAS